MYEAHPSHVLHDLFRCKPFQGAVPEETEFLFVGLDANYPADIEQRQIFPCLVRYHEDGPSFWRHCGVHHPFLLGHPGTGSCYHQNFAKIGFQAKHAYRVSFVELLHLPTVGQSRLEPRDLNRHHLQWLHEVIFNGAAKYIFVSKGVLKLMRSTGFFPEIPEKPVFSYPLRILLQNSRRTVFLHLHFSTFGRFEAQRRAEARAIKGLLQCGIA